MKALFVLLCVALPAICADIMGPYSSVFKGWSAGCQDQSIYVYNKNNPCCFVGYNTEPLGLEGGESVDYAGSVSKKLGGQLYRIIRVVYKSDGFLWCYIYARVDKSGVVFDRLCVYPTSEDCVDCQKTVEKLITKWELSNRR